MKMLMRQLPLGSSALSGWICPSRAVSVEGTEVSVEASILWTDVTVKHHVSLVCYVLKCE